MCGGQHPVAPPAGGGEGAEGCQVLLLGPLLALDLDGRCAQLTTASLYRAVFEFESHFEV